MSNPVILALGNLARDLDSLGARWALISGFAVSAWAETRFTRVVDVCVAVADDFQAERLIASLMNLGYTVTSIVEQYQTDRLATVRLSTPATGGVIADLLFASSGIEPEIVEDAAMIDIVSGLGIPVARPGHLVALKLLSVDDNRPQDAIDLHALRQVLTDEERERAQAATRTIEERGFQRTRELSEMASRYLRDGRVPD